MGIPNKQKLLVIFILAEQNAYSSNRDSTSLNFLNRASSQTSCLSTPKPLNHHHKLLLLVGIDMHASSFCMSCSIFIKASDFPVFVCHFVSQSRYFSLGSPPPIFSLLLSVSVVVRFSVADVFLCHVQRVFVVFSI